jgi:DNA-binding SARP family transcriptional activator
VALGVEFRLLGEFEVRVDDDVVNVGPTRQKCVLIALLLDANKLVPVDQLVERVWADAPPRRALNTLYGYVHRLRHSLADVRDVEIIRKPGGYTLTVDPATVDVDRFRDRTARARAAQEEERRLELLGTPCGSGGDPRSPGWRTRGSPRCATRWNGRSSRPSWT